jgi:hypothetical protein
LTYIHFEAIVRLTALAAEASGVGAAAGSTVVAPQAGSAPQPGSQQPLPAEQSGSPQQLSQQLALRHFFAL